MLLEQIRPLYELIAYHATHNGESPASLAPQRKTITYREFYDHTNAIGKILRAHGIRRNTQVAIVLPDGQEMLLALLGVAAFATAAPLNPKFLTEEFGRYFNELEARLLIVGPDENPQAVAAAQAANLPVLRLSLDGPNPGLTALDGTTFDTTSLPAADPAQPDDIAVLTHTSGTTGRPKIVPLTQRNIFSAAASLMKLLKVNPDSRNLNVLPMFHISGMLVIYCMLLTGASQINTAGFDPAKFFDWLDEFQPTFFGCAPTMFSLLVDLAEKNRAILKKGRLRYIVSGTASMPQALLKQVEATFGVTLIDTYGSTEAIGMTCNGSDDIPPRPGSVGKAQDAIIAIMADSGELLPTGQRGEVVVRGPSVMSGYWRNPEANAEAFRDGWYRTGDQGYLDEDGYLFLTGRLKEMINRGGEKISPYEVEQALLAHPAVAQAAAFAIPHVSLGELVAAAVVLKPDQAVTEAALRSFLVEQITYFKIPSKFVFTDNLPKNRVGKVERLSLAALYGLNTLPSPAESSPDGEAEDKPLGGSVEAEIFRSWSEVLGHAGFGLDHNFFDLGGTSLEATEMVRQVQQRFNRLITVTTLVEYPTLRGFSLAVRRADPIVMGGPLQTLQNQGHAAPLFIIHGAEGYGYHYHDLAKLLAPDVPVYAFTSIGRPGEEVLEFRLPHLARLYNTELRKVQPHGPYRLAGHSSGGILALEMAQQLRRQGEEVSFLGMFDSTAPGLWKWYLTPIQNWFVRHPLPFFHLLASALQPEAYAAFTAKAGDGSFNEERVAKMNWLDATWYCWHYLRKLRGQPLPKKGRLPGPVIRKVPVKQRSNIWNLSKLFFMHQAQEIADYLNKHPEKLQQSEVKSLLRAAWQSLNILGVAQYRARRPYPGEVVIFQAEEGSQISREAWQQVVQGKIEIYRVKGDHGNHIRLPYAVEVSKLLRKHLLA